MKNELENHLLMFYFLSLSNLYRTLNITIWPLTIKKKWDIKNIMMEKKEFIISYIYI
jgi:hypothetical protein